MAPLREETITRYKNYYKKWHKAHYPQDSDRTIEREAEKSFRNLGVKEQETLLYIESLPTVSDADFDWYMEHREEVGSMVRGRRNEIDAEKTVFSRGQLNYLYGKNPRRHENPYFTPNSENVENILDEVEQIPLEVPEHMSENGASMVCLGIALDERNMGPVHTLLTNADPVRNDMVAAIGLRGYMEGYLQDNFFEGSTREKDWSLVANVVDSRRKANAIFRNIRNNPEAAVENLERMYRLFATGAMNTNEGRHRLTLGALANAAFDALNQPEFFHYSHLTRADHRAAFAVKGALKVKSNVLRSEKALAMERERLVREKKLNGVLQDDKRVAKAYEDLYLDRYIEKMFDSVSSQYHTAVFSDTMEAPDFMVSFGKNPDAFREVVRQKVRNLPEFKQGLEKIKMTADVTSSNVIQFQDAPEKMHRLITDSGDSLRTALNSVMKITDDNYADFMSIENISKANKKEITKALKDLKSFIKAHKKDNLSSDEFRDALYEKIYMLHTIGQQLRADYLSQDTDLSKELERAVNRVIYPTIGLLRDMESERKIIKEYQDEIIVHADAAGEAISKLKDNIYDQQGELMAHGTNKEDPETQLAIAKIIVNKVLLGTVERNVNGMTDDVRETLTDEKSIEQSAKDMVKSESFKELLKTVDQKTINELATVQENGRYIHKGAPVDKIYNMFVNGVSKEQKKEAEKAPAKKVENKKEAKKEAKPDAPSMKG